VQQARATTTTVTANGTASAGTSSTRPRPQPIAGTPPPDPAEKCDHKMIQQTCTLFGLDLVINFINCINNENRKTYLTKTEIFSKSNLIVLLISLPHMSVD
jgi:hypothetical protein